MSWVSQSDSKFFLLQYVVDGGVDVVTDDDRSAQLVVLGDVAVSVVDHLRSLHVLFRGGTTRRVDPRADENAFHGVDGLRVQLSGGRHVARDRELGVYVLLHASFPTVRLHRPRRLYAYVNARPLYRTVP